MIYKSATFTKTTIHLYYFLDSIKIQFGSDLKSLMKGYFRRYYDKVHILLQLLLSTKPL